MKRILSILAVAAALISLIGCGADSQVSQLTNQPAIVLTELQNESKWAKVTQEPYLISSVMSTEDCKLPTQREVELPRVANPHEGSFINVYVSAEGLSAFLSRGQKTFPIGGIIVKEKMYVDVEHWEHQKTPDLYTVMVKRAPGYNPDGGDWEYAVMSADRTTVEARGKIDKCMRCHQTQATRGYVFGTYLQVEGQSSRLEKNAALTIGMSETELVAEMKPRALESGTVYWGGTGARRVYFHLNPGEQIWCELSGPAGGNRVTAIGPIEQKTKWTRHGGDSITVE